MLGTERQQRSARRLAFAFGLQHRLGHFLHEQRNAISALNDVLPDILPEAACCPMTRSIMAATSRSPSRLRVSAVT